MTPGQDRHSLSRPGLPPGQRLWMKG
jgi:hypothetical protein